MAKQNPLYWKSNSHDCCENGGLNFLNFSALNNTLKINWIRQFLRNPTSIWNFIFNHVFSKLNYTDHFFIENCFNHGIYPVSQLFNSNGTLISYSEFLNKHRIPIPPKEYAIVFDAIPSGGTMLFENVIICELTLLPLEPAETDVGQTCFSLKKITMLHMLYFKMKMSLFQIQFHIGMI